jgi:hypothetical protein
MRQSWTSSRSLQFGIGGGGRTVADGLGKQISYSSNWCGASQHTSDKADAIKNVSGYFQVPDLRLRPGNPPPQFAAAWIGIDGAECNTTLLQAGVTTVVSYCSLCCGVSLINDDEPTD